MTQTTPMPTAEPAQNDVKIQILKGREHVRKRPGMYIGGTGRKGLLHCAKEVIDNSRDENMAGYCSEIGVVLGADGSTLTVSDNGRGIPVSIHPIENVSQLEIVMTVLNAGGKFDDEGYPEGAGGLHGVGVSCVNALSEFASAVVYRDGFIWSQSYKQGIPDGPVEQGATTRKRGTSVTFKPDDTIFTEGIQFNEEELIELLRQTSFLCAGLKCAFESLATGRKETFLYAGGIADYVSDLNDDETGRYPATPLYVEKRQDEVRVMLALQWAASTDRENILSFANNVQTVDGGTHVSGFEAALTRIVNQYAKAAGVLKATDAALLGSDIREGLTGILSVRLRQPQFEGQTKSKLGSPEVRGIVTSVVGELLSEFFDKNPAVLTSIAKRAQIAQKAREAAKKIAESVKRESAFGRTDRLPGKLTDCDSDDRATSELWIVEGDSAAGSTKGGRNPSTQAVYPVRGKLLNAAKADLPQLLKNAEIQGLISVMGTGVNIDGEGFDYNGRRYDKICQACDADIDGLHIHCLLLTFFFRFMRPLIEYGHVYIAQAPLYRVTSGKTVTYGWSDADRDAALKAGGSRSMLTRFKGLGEMNPEEMGDTTMNPVNRRLIRPTLDDAAQAERILETVMGKNVAARKDHITEYFGQLMSRGI